MTATRWTVLMKTDSEAARVRLPAEVHRMWPAQGEADAWLAAQSASVRELAEVVRIDWNDDAGLWREVTR